MEGKDADGAREGRREGRTNDRQIKGSIKRLEGGGRELEWE